jgi:hypothetical protein
MTPAEEIANNVAQKIAEKVRDRLAAELPMMKCVDCEAGFDTSGELLEKTGLLGMLAGSEFGSESKYAWRCGACTTKRRELDRLKDTACGCIRKYVQAVGSNPILIQELRMDLLAELSASVRHEAGI